MLQKEMIVVSVFDEEKTVLQQFVGFVEILAEQRATRFRKRALFYLAPNAAEGVAHLAVDILLVGLDFGNLCAHHVRLFAVFEMVTATRGSSPCTRPGCWKTGR